MRGTNQNIACLLSVGYRYVRADQVVNTGVGIGNVVERVMSHCPLSVLGQAMTGGRATTSTFAGGQVGAVGPYLAQQAES